MADSDHRHEQLLVEVQLLLQLVVQKIVFSSLLVEAPPPHERLRAVSQGEGLVLVVLLVLFAISISRRWR